LDIATNLLLTYLLLTTFGAAVRASLYKKASLFEQIAIAYDFTVF